MSPGTLTLTPTLTLTLTRYRVLPRGTSLHVHGGRIAALHLLLRGEVALYHPTAIDPEADAPCWRLPARQGIGGEKLSPTGKVSPTHGAGSAPARVGDGSDAITRLLGAESLLVPSNLDSKPKPTPKSDPEPDPSPNPNPDPDPDPNQVRRV